MKSLKKNQPKRNRADYMREYRRKRKLDVSKCGNRVTNPATCTAKILAAGGGLSLSYAEKYIRKTKEKTLREIYDEPDRWEQLAEAYLYAQMYIWHLPEGKRREREQERLSVAVYGKEIRQNAENA